MSELDFLDEEVKNILMHVSEKINKPLKIEVRANTKDELWNYFLKILKFLEKNTKIKFDITNKTQEGLVIIKMGDIQFFGMPTGDLFGVFINTLALLTGALEIENDLPDLSKLKNKKAIIVTFAGENCPHCAKLSFYTNIVASATPIKHIVVNIDRIPDSIFKPIFEKYFKPNKIDYIPIQVILEDENNLLSGRLFRKGGEQYIDKYIEFLEANL